MIKPEAIRVCSNCIYDSDVPGIEFDAHGVCNYCRQVESLIDQYGTGSVEGQRRLDAIVEEIRRSGSGKTYDCVVGVSGGTDSSFLLMQAVDWGLRPLAVHYDNTWNSAIATENIRKITSSLGVDLYTYVIENREADDLFLSFIRAGVPEFDAATDIAFVQVLRSAAARHGIKHILEGHSFVAEGISPMGKNYFDGKYIESVHRRFGSTKLRTYPNMKFWSFMKWTLWYRQAFVRPLWYSSYSKASARDTLAARTGWSYYGGHHLENRATMFAHTVYLPGRFGIDTRNLSLAAEVRAGLMDREEALRVYRTPIEPDPELVAYVKKRLGLSDDEYQRIMDGPKRTFRDFKTYKKRFERLRPLFRIMADAQLVPMSFYLKYCFPLGDE